MHAASLLTRTRNGKIIASVQSNLAKGRIAATSCHPSPAHGQGQPNYSSGIRHNKPAHVSLELPISVREPVNGWLLGPTRVDSRENH